MKPKNAQIVPFFVVNHQLDIPSLRQFVRDCAEAGLDGFFFHAREGLLTPYLSEAWFKAFGACLDEAKKCGIKAWLYDEFPYPSGVAGGKVVESDQRFAERHLRIARVRLKGGRHALVPLGRDPVLHAFLSPIRNRKPDHRAARDVTADIGPFNDVWIMRKWDSRYYYAPKYAKLYDCPRSSANHPQAAFEADVPAGDWELTVFYVRTGADFVEPFGHYVDVSNREATQKFIEFTHEAYWKRFRREFGKVIPGFFTDEPKYRNTLPWSDSIAAEWTDYQKDPRALLTLAKKELRRPFPRRGEPMLPLPKLTGLEDADARARLRYRQTTLRLFRDNWARPISDWCRRHRVKLTGHVSPEKEWVQEAAICGSIAQLLKTFHIPGCDLIVPATGDRAHPILNFIAALPCSVAAQQGKPQVLVELYGANNYQMNVQDMKRIAEWLATFGVNLFTIHYLALSVDGYRKYDAPPTIYKPSTNWPFMKTWADCVRQTAERLGPLGVRVPVVIVRPMRTLWRLGLDNERKCRAIYERAMQFILGLQERGIMFHYVDDLDLGDVRVRDGSVQIGRARYEALVYLAGTLDSEAEAAVQKLLRQGGHVMDDARATRLRGPLRSNSGSIRAVQSKDGGWFCLNLSKNRESFTLNGKQFTMDGYESRWIEKRMGETANERTGENVRKLRLSSQWNMKPASDNVLVLKRWTMKKKRLKPWPYFEYAQPGEVKGWDRVSLGNIPTDPQLEKPKRLVYRTQFRVEGARDVKLVIEGETIRGKWTATLNGKPLRNWKKLCRYDASNREHDLRLALRRGLNRLAFTVEIEKSIDGLLDPCRLFGNFRVKNASGVPSLIPMGQVRGSDDWCKLGFPHYSGVMIYSQEFRWEKRAGERVFLTLPKPPHDQLVVILNGRRVGEMLWSPWKMDITKGLKNGENRLELHVSNTLTNMMYGKARRSGLPTAVTIESEKRPPR